ncbi:sensor histidine kinase [Dorea ammoniilytica]|uniref:histidine kinase n=1 Tax=Dorea ammoniilytica TaxID=2981788 RepID=A0ABT2S458_9FIRM|nr:ATP-binding protein [Dorea ammoniilytica]MCU6699354.1 ATP-binding protein [Dorea ammoniilytica]
MRQKMQHSMVFVLTATLVIAYIFLTGIMYRQTVTTVEEEIHREADYISKAVQISGTEYLNQMDEVRANTRITWISAEGTVLYDSTEDEHTFENHKNRPEVKKAFAKGEGEDIRKSDTIGEEMCYYAEKMPDGTVLRVSRTMNSAMKSAFHILPFMIFLALIMIVTAWLLSKWQIERLIRPINTLDLENPLEQEMYPELQPLLERIEQSNKEKEAMAAMRREFSANVSHELKTPLTSISGYAEIMKDGLVRPEDMQHFSEKIYQEASRLITLVEDIIKLSRLDEGRVELEKEEVDLYELSREIISRLAPQAAKNQVRLELTGESVKYTGIRQILDEMIYNITENAIKYNNPGGKVSVWAGNTLQGKKVVVTDDGIGIPEDQIDRIFERFYRVDKSHSKERGGTGLGLSIVKHGVMLHHGEVHVESKLGEGTRIELVFP